MRSRSLILLAVGLVLAGATGFALYRVSIEAQNAPAAALTLLELPAVVAKVDIPARTVITPDMVTTKKVPTDLLPSTVVANEGEAIGQTTLAPVPKGSFVFKPLLLSSGGKTGSSLLVEPGKVLVAFPTTDPLTTAGLVLPGDRIDLLATITAGQGETAKKTQTMVQNLEVIDVLKPTPEHPQQPLALTFQVDHQVALFLKYLRDTQAAVEVVVRAHDETELVLTQAVTIQVLQDTFGVK
jgi:pilus assembly protein CpaB